MPAISRIRFTNVIYENGGKRYNDETFLFDGHNTAFLLENGGGKTVFIQTALQAIIPHTNMAERKIKDTLSLENAPAHIAIEWIINDQPRRYAMTAVSLYIENNALNSLKYTYDYDAEDSHGIEDIPFSIEQSAGKRRPATRGEISDYYARMNRQSSHANTFNTIQDFGKFIENTYKIIPSEWRKVATINSGEGNVDEFFNRCKTTEQLLSNLLIPVVEEAIEGDHTDSFVETFERQRDHFKKNRILQDKIEQSQWIKEKIDDYVVVSKAYDKERKSLLALTEETKSVAQYVSYQKVTNEEAKAANENQEAILVRDRRAYDQEKKSYDLYLLNRQAADLETGRDRLAAELESLQLKSDDLAARKQNIEWTDLNREIEGAQAQMDQLQATLDTADKQVEIGDLKQQLEENSSHIKGQYVYELALIEREEENLAGKQAQLASRQEKVKEQQQAALAYEKDLIGKKSQLEAAVTMIEEDIQRLKDQIFHGDQPWTVALKQDSLRSRKDQLNKEIKDSEEGLESLKQYIQTKTKARESLVEQKLEARENLTLNRQQLEGLDQAMAEVKKDVEEAGYPVFMTGSLYSKEASIIKELEEQCAYAFKQKENAIRDERVALRQFDDYEHLNVFTAEPMLESFVEGLKKEFAFIELGSVYSTELKTAYNLSAETLYRNYPLWAVTLVTSVKDVDRVTAALAEKSDRLGRLVVVLSREEATRFGRGEESLKAQGSYVYPELWAMASDGDSYSLWQQRLRSQADEAVKVRREKEGALIRCEQWLARTRSFYETYPYETYESLKSAVSDFEQTLKQLSMDLSALELAILEDQDSLVKVSDRVRQLTNSLQQVEREEEDVAFLDKAQQRLLEAESARRSEVEALTGVSDQLEDYDKALKQIDEEGLDYLNQAYRYAGEKEKITGQSLYQEVKDYEPYGSNASLEGLKAERQRLKNRMAGLKDNLTEVESRLTDHQQMVKRLNQTKAKMVREAAYPLEKLEVYYQGEGEELYNQLGDLVKTMTQLKGRLAKEDRELTQITTRCQVQREALENSYGGVIDFDVAGEQIRHRLEISLATLQDRERKLAAESDHLEIEGARLDEAYRELEIKDGIYGYLGVDVEAAKLSVSYFDGFEDHVEDRVHELLQTLESQYDVHKKALRQLQAKEEEVLEDCREKVTDRRLLETLSSGLGANKSYKDLLIYQEKMTEIIMKIIKVAEDDKRESDLELQTFLSHLLAYVKSVSKELDVIQNKTRITVEDEVKQIFVFDLPDWDEDEAKLRLRNYIDETILFYEKESLHDDRTETDLRSSLAKRLSVMSLLEVVMEGRSIKIKCRKVSNDMKIGGAPMAWESSNKWSGGEKWSKNMTLFLSILNYLAEKKQHLSANQKRQRSVILDNPFGKASSDHVLKPVFMIADKLGFQIIALTAHSEGKFISDYFPVVYSCRLRKTTDPSKQVMTNEKVLNYSYLREHAPMTIMRMQDVEQMTLF